MIITDIHGITEITGKGTKTYEGNNKIETPWLQEVKQP